MRVVKFIRNLFKRSDNVLDAYVVVDCVRGCGTSMKVVKGELLTKKFVICPDCVEVLIAKAQRRKRETKTAKESDRLIVSKKLVYNF